MNSFRWRRAGSIATKLSLLFAVCSLLGCGGPEVEVQSKSREQVVGIWSASSGSRIEVRKDNSFTSYGMSRSDSLLGHCEAGSPSGMWGFYTDGDSGATDPSVNSGPSLGFVYDKGDSDCSFDLLVRVEKEGFSLCLTTDIDHACNTGVSFLLSDNDSSKKH